MNMAAESINSERTLDSTPLDITYPGTAKQWLGSVACQDGGFSCSVYFRGQQGTTWHDRGVLVRLVDMRGLRNRSTQQRLFQSGLVFADAW